MTTSDAIDQHLLRTTGGHVFRIDQTLYTYPPEGDYHETLGHITDPNELLTRLEGAPDWNGSTDTAARFALAVLLG